VTGAEPGWPEQAGELPRIAVFSGPTATIQNTPPLRTRATGAARAGDPSDTLRAQRLAAPAVVYVEQFSGHPLERDSADLYASPDGYLDPEGAFHPAAESQVAAAEPGWRPVLRIMLDPADGPFLLPYTARARGGESWSGSGLAEDAPDELQRQTFYPDASRLYEEIDRFGVDSDGCGRPLSSRADFAFFRAIPSGGYRKGLSGTLRTDHEITPDGVVRAASDIAPEQRGTDYFGYFPRHLRTEPDVAALARATNLLQETLGSGLFTGGQWLEGSPTTEESLYWFNLLLDITVPLAGHAAQRPHGTLSADGDRNIVDGVRYLVSRVWADEAGRDDIGTVLIADEVVYAARQVAKTDARPGNYVATGGFGGIVGSIEGSGSPAVTYRPAARHTWRSELRLPALPSSVPGLRGPVVIKDGGGRLLADVMPAVTIVTYGRYADDGCGAAGVSGWLGHARAAHQLAGIVAEGANPYGSMDPPTDAALRAAALSGVPVVKCGRGNTAGFAPRQEPWAISGNNLTATKARVLLLAALLKLGAIPPAADPARPEPGELARIHAAVAAYQQVFDTH
jgi:L-asparaginase